MSRCLTGSPRHGVVRYLSLLGVLMLAPPVKAQSVSAAEAQVQVNQYWRKKFSQCGDTLATRYVAGDWLLLKNGSRSVEPQALTQADALNGLRWHGNTRLRGSASRMWLPGQGWQQWEPLNGPGIFPVAVAQKNGRWTFNANGGGAIGNMMAPNCSDIPQEPSSLEQQNTRILEEAAVCEAAKKFEIGAAENYMRMTDDVNACQDSLGRTLLMLNIVDPHYNSDGVAIAIIRSGADLNIKDKNGFSALYFAVLLYNRDVGAGKSGDYYRMLIGELLARGADRQGLVAPDGRILNPQLNPQGKR